LCTGLDGAGDTEQGPHKKIGQKLEHHDLSTLRLTRDVPPRSQQKTDVPCHSQHVKNVLLSTQYIKTIIEKVKKVVIEQKSKNVR